MIPGRDGTGVTARSDLENEARASRESTTREYTPQRALFDDFGLSDGKPYHVKAAYTIFDGNNDKHRALRADLCSYSGYHRFRGTYFYEPPILVDPIDWDQRAWQYVSRDELEQAEHAWQHLFYMITFESAKPTVRRTGSPSLRLRAPYTSGRGMDISEKFPASNLRRVGSLRNVRCN